MPYYGFFLIFTGGILLGIYLCLVIKLFATHSWCLGAGGTPILAENSNDEKIIELWGATTTTFEYKTGEQEECCVVCLSKYEEGEQVRELPSCKHSFHAPCIDKWVFAHLHCPICRAPVDGNAGEPPEVSEETEASDAAVVV